MRTVTAESIRLGPTPSQVVAWCHSWRAAEQLSAEINNPGKWVERGRHWGAWVSDGMLAGDTGSPFAVRFARLDERNQITDLVCVVRLPESEQTIYQAEVEREMGRPVTVLCREEE